MFDFRRPSPHDFSNSGDYEDALDAYYRRFQHHKEEHGIDDGSDEAGEDEEKEEDC